MTDSVIKEFYSHIISEEDVLSFYAFVDFLNEKTFTTTAFSLKDFFQGGKVPNWFNVFSEFNIDPSQYVQLRTLAFDLRKNLQVSECVKMHTTFEPSYEFLTQLHLSLQAYLSMPFYISPNVSKDNAPGAKFFVKGMYLDATLQNRVFNFLKTNDVISRYL